MGTRRASSIGVRALRKRCADLVVGLRARGFASDHQIAHLRPGGEGNPGKTIDEWLYYHAALHRLDEAGRIRSGQSLRSGQSAAASVANEFELLHEVGAVGQRVALSVPLDKGRITSLTVEPKGMLALVEIHEIDRDCRWIASRAAVLCDLSDEGLATPEDLQALTDCEHRIAQYMARIVWVLTTPGAWCPYDPSREAEPVPPAYLLDLSPIDLTRILLAHREVNGDSDDTLAAYIPRSGDTPAAPMPWSVFYAATAQELGVDSELLLKHWSRKKVITQAVLSAKARLDAEAKAKAKAAAGQQAA